MPKPKNVQKRIDELGHPDADTRRKAAKKLGEYGDCNAVEPLCRALHDADAYVRSDAAWALGSLAPSLGPRHCDMAFGPLRDALGDKRPGLRHAAAWALGQLGVQQQNLAPRAVFCILHAAQKCKIGHRHNYIHALTEMGAAAVAPLSIEYSSRRSEIRQECIQQAFTFLEQTKHLDVAGALLSDASLTAPQQWASLEFLAASRPRSLFAPRHVTDARRYCEITAVNPRALEPARRGAQAVLDYPFPGTRQPAPGTDRCHPTAAHGDGNRRIGGQRRHAAARLQPSNGSVFKARNLEYAISTAA